MQTRLALTFCDGPNCENHPKDYWFVVDNNYESRPHLTINLDELDTRYFTQNGKLTKFNIILLEQLSTAQLPKFSVLKELLAPNGTFIFFGWRPSLIDFFNHELDIRQIYFFGNKMIVFTGEASISDVIEVINLQLKSRYMSQYALKELNYIHEVYQRLAQTRPHFPSLLLCVLAHMEMYVELRKTRPLTLWSFNFSNFPGLSSVTGKSPNQDDGFDKLRSDLEKSLESFINGDNLFEQVKNTIRLMKAQYATDKGEEQKPHTPIGRILDTSLEIIEYYNKLTNGNRLKLRRG